MSDKIAAEKRAKIAAEKRAQIDRLSRFINALKKKERPDPEAMTAGIFVCVGEINRLKKSPGRPALKSYTMDTPQFTVAMDRARGNLTHEQATAMIAALCSCDPRHAERFLAKMKTRAESTSAFLDALKAEAIADSNSDE